MDHSPIDIETLSQMANALFRAGTDKALLRPGPADIPSPTPTTTHPAVTQAASPYLEPAFDPRGAGPSNLTAGGATFSPSAPPDRPAFGRAISAETPMAGYGTGQPRFGTSPSPTSQNVPLGFDPRSIPGFGPIPHVEDGFDVSALGPLEPLTRPTRIPGFAAAPVPPSPGPLDIPPLAQGTASAFDATDALSFALPEGGAPGALSAPANQSPFGHPVLPDVPTSAYGAGQPHFGVEEAAQLGLAPRTLSGTPQLPDGLHGIDATSLQSFLAPTNVPGLAAFSPTSYPPSVTTRIPDFGRPSRSIDRPTPNAFEFTDASHLGEFPEGSILRAQIGSQPGADFPKNTPVTPSDLSGFVPSAAPSFYFLDDGMGYFANDVPKLARPSAVPFNAEAVRVDFPILQQRVNGYPLVWLDNGATTQKPQAVIDRISSFYENENSNINRSAHELAARASDAYEDARKTVQRFINAPTIDELVFVRGTTEGINFVAQSFGRRFIKAGDEIVLTHAEHHANIVPWYLLAKEVGATLRVVPFDDNGEILLDEYENLLNDRVKIVAMSHVSNALGTVLPAKAMVEMAHRHGIPVLVDGAQSISHMPIDVQDIDCDFFVFSGHKVFAPTGIGAVYGKKALLDQMPPWQGGGNMIKDVTFEKITFQPAPGRFEAGTGNIADAVGLGEAFKYLERLGMTNIAQHEHALLEYATQRLAPIKGLTVIGNAKEKAGVISFLLDGKEPVEVGKALNQKGIAVRAGHHCALPILRRYGVEATVRPAFAMYNTFDDADRLAEAVREIAVT